MWKRALCLLVIVMALFSGAVAQEPPPAWNGQSRFTVLILGMDRRPNARDTFSVRTDVIIVASIDPASGRIGLIHLPRDLHLTPPGSEEYLRINSLLVAGEELQAGYGPYYAMDVIQYNLGMYIDRYLAFDFAAFETLIDALGGVVVDVPYTLDDPLFPDMNYGYDPLYIPAGRQRLSGYDALRYVRTRHNDNDYQRGQRQLQVIGAVHQQLQDQTTFISLVNRADQLLQAVQQNIYTDLTLTDMLQLGQFVINVPPENIATGAIDTDNSFMIRLDDGQAVAIPDRVKLLELMIEVFGQNYAG